MLGNSVPLARLPNQSSKDLWGRGKGYGVNVLFGALRVLVYNIFLLLYDFCDFLVYEY